jgi:photosystem II stability/assembly factor-like uncharacterized protein/tetratricopeptide (TPR) repeat protein
MRPLCALLVLAAMTVPGYAADLRAFEDAALHAVQFVDAREGWAVGDQGVVMHTIDGGTSWERQPTGVRGSLRALCFLTPYSGWVVGREELPNGGGSTGVLLVTRDGGLKWHRVLVNSLPGLNTVRFFDDQNGIVAGDGSEAYPTGLITTADGGKTWKPLAGPRCPPWLGADFSDSKTGALVGTWSRMARWSNGTLGAADVDSLLGRSVCAVRALDTHGIAVGQGGLVLVSNSNGGQAWGVSDLKLPAEAVSCLDFHAVACQSDHIWMAGRPGSLVMHSADRGKTWHPQWTGQTMPLHGLFFRDAKTGWAVGELGTILGTIDGGQTWKVQNRGGERVAVLFVHARPSGIPLGTIARLGGAEGYLTAALRVTSPSPKSAPIIRASDPQRLEAALRQAGGAAADSLWQFPLPAHLETVDRKELLNAWNEAFEQESGPQMLRQLVLALRMWQPDVIVTDGPNQDLFYGEPYGPVEGIVAETLKEAFKRAADPKEFPEQIDPLGLKPWKATKLYARSRAQKTSCLIDDTDRLPLALRAMIDELTEQAVALMPGASVGSSRVGAFDSLASRLPDPENDHALMYGISLAPGGTARREARVETSPEREAEIVKAVKTRNSLETLSGDFAGPLSSPDKMLAQIGPGLDKLPADQGAPAAFAIASRFVKNGQWELAREAYLLLVDRYPMHPLAADAYRWLIRYSASSEARRRHELGQFMVVTQETVQQAKDDKKTDHPIHGGPEAVETERMALLGSLAEVRKWYEGPLQIAPRLATLGPIYERDPAVQFCLQAARRNLGKFDEARDWYVRFLAEHPEGPWHDAAAAELWLTNRSVSPPKLIATCPQTLRKPVLDGVLDDACWKDRSGLRFVNAVGDTVKDSPTEAWLAYDQEYLYLAVRCKHPLERYVEPAKEHRRDADLSKFDHVSLLLDLDRDYNTYYRLEVDQRGCVCEDCWGDKSWDPRWFVSVKSEPTGWQLEAAIPLVELTGEPITVGHAWACNVVRTLPGRGVQAWSVPADVEPRPEGMGLLMFLKETPPATAGTTVPVRKTVE